MAIDLAKEKKCEFSAQDRYDIISAAIEAAYDDGFMNAFVFGRTLYCFAYALLDDSDAETQQDNFAKIRNRPLLFWNEHLEEIEAMIEQHEEGLTILAEDANEWFTDYTTYAYSMRGMLDNLGDIMQGVTQRAEDELYAMQSNGELQSVIGIAEEWGLNRESTSLKVEDKPTESESLFV